MTTEKPDNKRHPNGASGTYARRFQKVFDYIHTHLDEALSVETLSRVAHFSKFHFHRQFFLFVGLNVTRYIQLLRLKRASYRLVFEPKVRVIEIALQAGFENPESFSRAFKAVIGQTPSQFRKGPAWQPWTERFQIPAIERTEPMEVSIVDFPATTIAVLEHRGAPALVYDSVQRFIDWRKTTGLSPVNSSRHFGIAYDDPATTPPEQFRFDLGGSVTAPVPENAWDAKDLPPHLRRQEDLADRRLLAEVAQALDLGGRLLPCDGRPAPLDQPDSAGEKGAGHRRIAAFRSSGKPGAPRGSSPRITAARMPPRRSRSARSSGASTSPRDTLHAFSKASTASGSRVDR